MVLIFGLTLWLAAYLLLRGSHLNSGKKMVTLCAGVGLILYVVALACQILSAHVPSANAYSWLQIVKLCLLVGLALFWLGTLISVSRQLFPWQAAVGDRQAKRRQLVGILLFATIAFALAIGGLFMPISWSLQPLIVAGIGFDVLLLGYAVAELDAFDLGESLWPDFLRSLEAATLAALLFGGPVAVTILVTESAQLALWTLLLVIVAIAVLSQVFAEPLQSLIDGFAFRAAPTVRQERADLRKTASTLPRLDQDARPEQLDEAEFARHTRRALSHYGDLARLSTNPLTRLPLVDKRLAERDLDDNTLTRAAELKRLLSGGIAHLKPNSDLDFDSTEEWRYYNALHFPYVMGIKPYSRRAMQAGTQADLSPDGQQALEWFRQQVPERTLHNWQNAAAKLVAQYLRELDA